jgi:multicomponent Na+:H+ antiporter subunit F
MDHHIPETVIIIAMALLLAALFIGFIRLAKGPGVAERVAAFDLIALTILAFILLYSVHDRNAIYIDITIIIALVAFIGTVAVSSYLKQKG